MANASSGAGMIPRISRANSSWLRARAGVQLCGRPSLMASTYSRIGPHKRFRMCIWEHSLAAAGATPLSRASFTLLLGGTEQPSLLRESTTPLSTKYSGKVLHMSWQSIFRREGLLDHHWFHSSERFGLTSRNELRTQCIQMCCMLLLRYSLHRWIFYLMT